MTSATGSSRRCPPSTARRTCPSVTVPTTRPLRVTTASPTPPASIVANACCSVASGLRVGSATAQLQHPGGQLLGRVRAGDLGGGPGHLAQPVAVVEQL